MQVIGISGVSAIASQLALKPDGSVYGWGPVSDGSLYGLGPGPTAQIGGFGGTGYLDLGVSNPANFAVQTDLPLPPAALFLLAIGFSSWWGGLGPGIVAMA